jgi:hypothetical protein
MTPHDDSDGNLFITTLASVHHSDHFVILLLHVIPVERQAP